MDQNWLIRHRWDIYLKKIFRNYKSVGLLQGKKIFSDIGYNGMEVPANDILNFNCNFNDW